MKQKKLKKETKENEWKHEGDENISDQLSSFSKLAGFPYRKNKTNQKKSEWGFCLRTSHVTYSDLEGKEKEKEKGWWLKKILNVLHLFILIKLSMHSSISYS